MSKVTEAQIDALIKHIKNFKDDSTVLHLMIGWFKSRALEKDTGRRAQLRRAEGRAFFSAIEYLIEADHIRPKL